MQISVHRISRNVSLINLVYQAADQIAGEVLAWISVIFWLHWKLSNITLPPESLYYCIRIWIQQWEVARQVGL